ncbi:MAG: riboflavin synthase [Clostridia bacterium]|jgi:riboflavin synthase|nr:riboflavin synthase [Clostridia bacterium]MBQ1375767.1 riboflavin synthase [Clostridia bacterium]MBQ1434910.1 riboflavin synthase [Clostridia bacterium]
MFTGIIEETGRIAAIKRGARSSVLTIAGDVIFGDVALGDSVAVNGVCLTVTSFKDKMFTADVMSETLSRSSLGSLKVGSPVNLERAMSAGGRFGGHIVSGHIDGTGTIKETRADDNAVWYTIKAGPDIMRYIVEKGSIAIDGISLTVARVSYDDFAVSVIPHTAKVTALGIKRAGDVVNLECDIIGKYVERLLTFPGGDNDANAKPSGGNITKEFLMKYGF